MCARDVCVRVRACLCVCNQNGVKYGVFTGYARFLRHLLSGRRFVCKRDLSIA